MLKNALSHVAAPGPQKTLVQQEREILGFVNDDMVERLGGSSRHRIHEAGEELAQVV